MGEGRPSGPVHHHAPRAPLFEALMMHRSRLDPGNSPDFEVCTLAVHQNAPKCTIFCVFSPAYANMSGDETKCNENELVERAAGPQVFVKCIILHRFASLFRFFALHRRHCHHLCTRSFCFASSWLRPRCSVATKAACLICHARSVAKAPSLRPQRPDNTQTHMLGKYSKISSNFSRKNAGWGFYFNCKPMREMSVELKRLGLWHSALTDARRRAFRWPCDFDRPTDCA